MKEELENQSIQNSSSEEDEHKDIEKDLDALFEKIFNKTEFLWTSKPSKKKNFKPRIK